MDYHHQHQLHSSSSPSPSFFFSSPPSAFFHGGYGASPSPSSHSFLPPPSSSASSSSSSYSASFFDSSPLQLPRRSPRLSSRHVSAFSPSPSLLTRSLSPPSSKRCRRDSSVGFYDPPTSSTHSFDEPWTSVFTAPVGQASASSRSTPLTSREGKVRDTKGGSDRLGDRSITGDGDGRYTQTHMQEPDDAPDAQRPSGASSAKIQRLQQQLLRAASGDAFGAAQKVREDKDEGDVATPSSSSSSAYPAHGSGGFDDEQQRFPASSSSSASSTSSYPASLSSLSTGFSSSPSGVTPADGPDAAVSSLALLSPTQTGRTSPSSPTFRPGESCHQCKTRRLVPDLIFCSARHMKKGRARKKKKERACRKKYCARCLSKFYGEDVPDSALPWVCPGCRGICSCAACKRHASRREAREKKAAKAGKKRKGGHLEKASAAKMVRAAGVTSGTAVAAPVAAIASTSVQAVPVSVSIPIDGSSFTPSLAITLDTSSSSSSAHPMPMPLKREPMRRSPRLQQRPLQSQDVVALGPMTSSSSSSSSRESPTARAPFDPSSPISPSAFTFSAHHVASHTAPSPLPFASNAYSASPILPSSMLLSSPPAHYPSFSSFSSPLLPPHSLSFSPMVVTRRSPRVAGRTLSDHGDWRQQYEL